MTRIRVKGERQKKGRRDFSSYSLRLISFTVCLTLSLFILSSCENSQQAIFDITGKKTEIEEAINVQSLFSQNGRMKAKLWAPLMRRFHNDTLITEFPKTMHVNFFDSAGAIESHLDANTGKYFENLNKVHLRDSVVVFNTKGDTLWTPELWWDQNAQRFYTDTIVRIHKIDGTRINARYGMETPQDLSDILFKHPTGGLPFADSLKPQ